MKAAIIALLVRLRILSPATAELEESMSENPSDVTPSKSKWKLSLALIIVAALLPQGYQAYFHPENYGFSWDFFKKTSYYVTYPQTCAVTVKDSEEPLITGKRVISYTASTLFGYEFHDKSTVTEKTYINVKGTGMALLGTTDGGAAPDWHLKISQGERYDQLIKPASRILALIDTKDQRMVTFDYATFCK